MSRFIEEGKDERCKYLLTTLDDPDVCKYRYNEVCCNDQNRDRLADFTLREECVAGACPYFGSEPPYELDALRKGVKTYYGNEVRP